MEKFCADLNTLYKVLILMMADQRSETLKVQVGSSTILF